jgi:class 3 adenylate cyclase
VLFSQGNGAIFAGEVPAAAEMARETDMAATGPSETVGRAPASSRGERRTITVLFADIVNSTGLAEGLDPEDWTEIMNDAFQHLTAPVRRYDGNVARLMGDGILAFFGAPVSHEDDPQRAVLAGLDIIAAVRGFGEGIKRRHGLDFDVRVGISTGPVVVADVGSAVATEYTAMGDAVNIAARMQQTAAAGTVQVSAVTWRLVAPLFDADALGDIELKGKSRPVAAFRVTGVKSQTDRLRGAAGVSAPLIGRGGEFARLKQAIDEVMQGRGQIVSMIGEAGLGKSRLLAELREYWLAQGGDPENWRAMYGIPYDTARPFGLFQNYARGIFGIQLDDPADVIHGKVKASLSTMGAPPEAMALCQVTMERVIAAKVLHDAMNYAPETIRADIYDVMYPAFRGSCVSGPVILVVDDLHWSDPASAELLGQLLGVSEEAPMLFLLAFRPERQSPAWQVKVKAETDFPHRYTEVVLRPLGAEDTDQLVSSLLDIADLPADLRALVLRKTDGNPYFIEEVVRSLIEQGVILQTGDGLRFDENARIADIAVPDSLQALLMARIDRLDEETRSTLQMASVIGRSFYYRLLQAISDSAMAVDKHLRQLERVELLREAGRLPELEYIFKHELARDAAYATILNRRRREFHLQVGDAMEKLFENRLEEHAHRLAQHFELAGDDVRALRYYEMAGEVAAGIHAQVEGGAMFARALEAARRLNAPEAEIARLDGKRAVLVTGMAAAE